MPEGMFEPVGKDGELVGAAVAVGVFEDFDPVLAWPWFVPRILQTFGDPDPAALVERHGHRIDDVGLAGHQLDAKALGHRHLGDRFGRRRCGPGGLVLCVGNRLVGGHRSNQHHRCGKGGTHEEQIAANHGENRVGRERGKQRCMRRGTSERQRPKPTTIIDASGTFATNRKMDRFDQVEPGPRLRVGHCNLTTRSAKILLSRQYVPLRSSAMHARLATRLFLALALAALGGTGPG